MLCVDRGSSGPVKRAQTGSEDPHPRMQNFCNLSYFTSCSHPSNYGFFSFLKGSELIKLKIYLDGVP